VNGDKTAGKVKMAKDPIFEGYVNTICNGIVIEGDYRKPNWKESFAVQVIFSPQTIALYLLKYHKRYISTAPLPMEDKVEMAQERVGMFKWDTLTEKTKNELIDRKIWVSAVYEQWVADAEAEAERKANKKMKKGGPRTIRSEGEETEQSVD
jgi:hypothetical protein